MIPELDYLSSEAKLRHKVHFNVLQEFTRSGMIDELILFDNELTLEHFGHGPIKDYYNIVNHYYYSCLHMNNYCKNVHLFSASIIHQKKCQGITTIGFSDLEKKEEKLLFQLDNITETCYIINASEDDLKTRMMI